MGIIIKQSFKGSIWSYLGLLVGYINLGIIMPNFFKTEQIGLVQIFLAVTAIFSNFSSLGFLSVINRMFPEFRNKKHNNHGFLFLLILVGLAGFILSSIAFFVFKPSIIEANHESSPLLVEYIALLVPLIFFRMFFQLLDNYNRVLYDAVTGTLWNEFVHKVVNLFLIVLFSYQVIDFRGFFYGYLFSLSMPIFPLIIVLVRRNEFNLKPELGFLKHSLIKEMFMVALFGMITGLSGTLTNNIDKLLINNYLSLEHVGIFSVCALFANVIMIPSRAMVNISTGIIASSWKDNNTKHIQEIYSKASLHQTIIGSLILAGIVVNLDNIFTILPETYQAGKWVLIIYSVGMLIRVSASTSGMILITSKFYKVMSIVILMQIVVIVFLNIYFIPKYGIIGAAIAVFLTYVFRTTVIVSFIKVKFGLFCYSLKHIVVMFLMSISIIGALVIPNNNYLVFNIFIKSGVVVIIFMSMILILKLSPDISNITQTIYQRILSVIKRSHK